ncbi:hypothetical protein [Spiroplasma endosymbiont of Labia minor]|uniref:hypothetical protein n=1 Tax=Spiroplasma endosymbiont of Labia minor TaxID=3066305 RepID=UPI0030D521F0
MKKILTIISGLSVIPISIGSVISCANIANFGYYSQQVAANMSQTEELSSFYKNSQWEWKSSDNKDLTYEILINGINMAVVNIVNSVRETDFKISIYQWIDSENETDKLLDEAKFNTLLNTKINVSIHLDGIANSKKWQGNGHFGININTPSNSRRAIENGINR